MVDPCWALVAQSLSPAAPFGSPRTALSGVGAGLAPRCWALLWRMFLAFHDRRTASMRAALADKHKQSPLRVQRTLVANDELPALRPPSTRPSRANPVELVKRSSAPPLPLVLSRATSLVQLNHRKKKPARVVVHHGTAQAYGNRRLHPQRLRALHPNRFCGKTSPTCVVAESCCRLSILRAIYKHVLHSSNSKIHPKAQQGDGRTKATRSEGEQVVNTTITDGT